MMTTLNNRVSALFADPLRNVVRALDPDFGWNGESNGTAAQKLAPVSMWEDGCSLHIEMDVPGLTVEDLDLSIEKGKLRIRGGRQAGERNGATFHEERCFGQFERYVSLTDWVDTKSIDASLRHGVLSITFAKRPEQQRQKIAITGESSVKKIEST